eukprot:c8319_g1_i1 orf=164-859(-)
MALPVSSAADREDEPIHGFDTTGYVQLPVEHLSDLSESSVSSNGFSDDLIYDTHEVFTTSQQAENLGATHNGSAIASINSGGPSQNERHVAQIDGMENQATAHISDALSSNGGHVIQIDGMEIHVYGQLAGLQVSSHSHHSHDDEENVDEKDDVDEIERQCQEDAASRRAKEADEARRLAPLPPDRCQAIKNAMQSISLSGFRPEWADRVPEEQWVSRLRRKSTSKMIESD